MTAIIAFRPTHTHRDMQTNTHTTQTQEIMGKKKQKIKPMVKRSLTQDDPRIIQLNLNSHSDILNYAV